MERRDTRPSFGRWLRRALPTTALVGAVLGVTAIGPGVFSALAGGLRHRSEAGVVVAPGVQARTPSTSTADAPTADAGPTRIIASPPPTTPAPVASTPAQTAVPTTTPTTTSSARAEVTMIQIVPAARDLVVQVDGTRYASAGDGTIALPPGARHGSVEFVGFVEMPPLRQATFGSWADGSTAPTRSLDTFGGPVVQLGVTISYRVTVDVVGADTAAFFSVLGARELPIGAPQWVPAVRAVSGPAGLVAQPINYTVQSVGHDGVQTPVNPSSYQPTPEALWTVSTT
jgi:hypothetical protein